MSASAGPSAGDNSSKKKEDWEIQRDAHKQLGDDAFRHQDYADAIRQYSNAVALDPTNHILLSNRSAAHLKQQQKSKALHDAQECVKHAPATYFKAFSRLGAALQSLGRWQAAKDAYDEVLNADANNGAAKKGKDECEKQLARIAESKASEQEEAAKKEEPKQEEEKDLLDDFFSEVEEASKPRPAEEVAPEPNVVKSEKKDLGTAQSQIDRLLRSNYKWRNLNPFYILDLPHNAADDDISRRYKAMSLLLHPDKCGGLGRAKEAYDEVQRAKNQLNDPDKARHVRQLVEQGRKQGKAEWQASGKKGDLSDVQSREVQRLFAQLEHKRKEVEARQRKQEQRERQQEEDQLEKERKERVFDKNWREEGRVGKRVGNWRDFSKGKKSKG